MGTAATTEAPTLDQATLDHNVCVEMQKYLTMVSPGKEQWRNVLDAMEAAGYEFERSIAGGEW